jgi:predicted GNAT family N-acyltransferase
VPAVLIGRLAIDLKYRQRRLGEFLLMDALKLALQSTERVGSYLVIVDAIDDSAAAFYQRYGFLPLVDHIRRLYFPMATIKLLDL